MSPRITLIVFIVLFSLALFLIVILPFVFYHPKATPVSPGEPAKGTEIVEERGVWRSDDGGKTWQQKAWIEGQAGNISTFRINRFIADPIDPETYYLATDGNGLWLTHSRGDLWAPVVDQAHVLQSSATILGLAVNPTNADEWFVAAYQEKRGRLFHTTDAGKTFREIYFTPHERFGVFDVYYDSARGAVEIVTGQGGYLESTNRGQTWRVVRWFASGLTRLLAIPGESNLRFVATPDGLLFRTRDRGTTWVDVSASFSKFNGAGDAQHWVVGPSGALYLGSRYGLLRSRDNAATFEAPPLIIPPDALPILGVAIDASNIRRIIVAAANQLYRTTDDGASWSFLSTPAKKSRIVELAIDRKDPNIIYAVIAP